MIKGFYGILTILVIGVIFISGCIQESGLTARAPTINLEATVISLSLTNVGEDPQDIMRPRDTGIIKIDKIISIDNPNNHPIEGIEVGNEIKAEFQNSARPTKIRQVFDPEAPVSSGNESTVSATHSFTIENGYFVYTLSSSTISEETEIILPGLEVGTKFRATVGYFGYLTVIVGKYEIIS